MSKKPKPDDNFVVYAYSRSEGSENGPEDSFYYIGKGRPERPYNCKSRKHIRCPRDKKKNIHILHKRLKENVAFDYEIKLIQFYGRIDTQEGWQTLRNLTDGGEGVSNPSSETRRKKSVRFKGKRNPMYGKIPSKEHRELTSKIHRGKNNFNYKPRNWYHPDYGVILQKSCCDIIEMYPKDNLISSGLSAVALGKRKYHRNWMCLGDEKNPPEGIMTQDEKRIDLGKRLDWYHKEHGEVKGVSATKLARMFPEKGLDPSCLTKVSKGKKKIYKGWVPLSKKELADNPPVRGILRDWYHPDIGIVRGVTASQMPKMFPQYGLRVGSLNDLANGKLRTHSGWSLPPCRLDELTPSC
jgi:hypothetical protein